MSPSAQGRTPTAAQGESVRLVVLEGGRIGQKLVLNASEMVVGRAEDSDIHFDDAQLSRRHAILRRLGPGFYEVRDLQSRNGTFVNGAPATDPISLKLGDRIRFGSNLVVQLTVHDPLEDQLLQRQRLETLGQLVAGIAHDFNNMLGAVLSNISYLESLPPEESIVGKNASECLADMRGASIRAAELSQRLVGFARGERGSGLLNVSAVCGEVANIVARTFDRSVEVHSEVTPRLESAGDDLELYQLLMNLCMNARDAMPKGGTLTLLARPAPGEQGKIEVAVTDTGMGMSPATQARIFEAFFTTKEGAGFGLGLATAREIVERLGGTIEVESKLDRGTTFRLLLPRSPPRGRMPTTSRVQSLRSSDDATRALTILLVDDENMIRRSARRILTQAGHDVVEASCGAEALTAYMHGHPRPDVVLLDLSMPDGRGDDVLVRLLELDPEACVIIVSGHHDAERERALQRAGAAGFIHKPWKMAELLSLIESRADDKATSDQPTRT